ncbi:alpha/beta hydrolase family protein [Hyperthermus butylicus]|uniref:Acyl-peptide hydrolase n=1 Tax=Hyperthermus butylicus (strain DSM 5456 / JCM 9403 / PLM1-5) TaxID=415426 RepID=A2BK66_HYPBU|nr:S9 family peptidase [Hyperthermus butylicus]ABM80377.1 putative peptidase [Hyperthermus butylicus DSM 5456]
MTARVLTPETLRNIVLVSNPAITPDGGKILYTVARINIDADTYESSISLLDVATGFEEPLQQGPSDSCPIPAPNGRHYVFIRRVERDRKQRGQPGLELRFASIDRPGASRLIARVHGLVSVSWSPDSLRLAAAIPVGLPDEDVKVVETLPVWFNGKGFIYKTQVKPFIVDVYSGYMEEIKLDDVKWMQVADIAWSPDGRKIAVTVSRVMEKPYLRDLYVYYLDEDRAELVAEKLSGFGEIVWSPDSRYIAYLGHRRERGFATHNKILVFDTEDRGSEPECLTCSLDRNAVNTANSDVRFSSCLKKLQWTRKGILFVASDHGRAPLYSVEPGSEPTIVIDPGEGVVDEFSATPDGARIAYTRMTATEPREVYVSDGGNARRLTRHNDTWLSRYKLSKPEKFVFKASDGVEVEGWILRPPEGVEEKGWVLYIHGGPKTMFGYGFMHEFHVLAGRGYTVVYTNPRGSDGYSEEFADIRCRYGERDYQDLMEAVEYVIERYRLPRDKAAVMGGSYGGFMTNWIIGHTDLFKAAVTMRSISNWISMYGTTDIGWYFVEDQICCTPWRNFEHCWEKSPLKYADRVKTPTLIIHSNEDYRCWLDQALQLYTALKLHGVETRLAIFPNENHDLSRSGKPKHRVKRLQLILEWLDEHLAGKKEEEKAGREAGNA